MAKEMCQLNLKSNSSWRLTTKYLVDVSSYLNILATLFSFVQPICISFGHICGK